MAKVFTKVNDDVLKESVGENPMRQQCPHCHDYRMTEYDDVTKIATCYSCMGRYKVREF